MQTSQSNKKKPRGGVSWDNDNFQTTPAFLKILQRKHTHTKSQQTALLSMMPNFNNNDNFIKDARLLRLEVNTVETTDQNS